MANPKNIPGIRRGIAALMLSLRMHHNAEGGMILDGRLPEGYVVLCAADGDEQHSFLVQRLGPSVECPACGRTALSAPLVEDYYRRRQPAAPARERPDDARVNGPRAEFRVAAE